MTKFKHLMMVASLVMAPGFAALAQSDDNTTVEEKVDEVYQDTKKEAKKAGRKVKDETCKMVHGKMECAAKKVKHKVQNATDEIKDKADDIKKESN